MIYCKYNINLINAWPDWLCIRKKNLINVLKSILACTECFNVFVFTLWGFVEILKHLFLRANSIHNILLVSFFPCVLVTPVMKGARKLVESQPDVFELVPRILLQFLDSLLRGPSFIPLDHVDKDRYCMMKCDIETGSFN